MIKAYSRQGGMFANYTLFGGMRGCLRPGGGGFGGLFELCGGESVVGLVGDFADELVGQDRTVAVNYYQ